MTFMKMMIRRSKKFKKNLRIQMHKIKCLKNKKMNNLIKVKLYLRDNMKKLKKNKNLN